MAAATRARVSIWALAFLIGPLVVGFASRRPLVDNSFLWHVTAGDIQLMSHRVLTADPFSFLTVGEAWRTQSWLVELWYSWGVDLGTIGFGQWVPPVVGGLFFLIIATLIRSVVSVGPGSGITMAFTAIVMLPYLQPRPVVVSYLLVALVLLAMRERMYWTIPLLMWVWASAHGSFFLGFVIMGTEWFRVRRADAVKAAIGSLVIINFTAHGFGVWEILVSFARGREALERISEWLPPDLLAPRFIPVVIMVAVVIAWVSRHPMPRREGLPLLAWLVFGLTASRSMPLFWIMFVPTAAQALVSATEQFRSSASAPGRLIGALGIVMIVVPLLGPAAGPIDAERFPIEAATHLTAERVFHDDVVGGYLIYTQWPDRLIYVDDRAELYGDRLIAFADARAGMAGWDDELARAKVAQVLVRQEDALASLLEVSGDWSRTYEDEDFLIYDQVTP